MRCYSLLTLAAVVLLSPSVASAQTVIYGFENLTVGRTSPVLSVAPDSGDASFRTTFTSAPSTGAFSVFAYISGLQPSFSGKFFSSRGININVLTLVFNQPVTGLHLDYTASIDINGPRGHFQATTPSQTFSVGTMPLGFFQGGALDFANATPFNTVQLTALSATGDHLGFSMDNLVLTTLAPVPEPGSVALFIGMGISGMALRRRRK